MICGAFFIDRCTFDSIDPKRGKFEWDEQCEQNFQELKNCLFTTPVLTLPTFGAVYVICSDAFRQGLGCVLMQGCRMITYVSC